MTIESSPGWQTSAPAQSAAATIHVPTTTSQSIDWYGEGETRIVQIGNLQIEVRFVGRKGRRARIAITAPSGAVFR